jgi:hypothetical protein
MIGQKNTKIVGPLHRNPRWFDEANDQLELASDKLQRAYDSLKAMYQHASPGLYSNQVLHKIVNKQTECEKLLAILVSEHERLLLRIQQNKQFYFSHQLELNDLHAVMGAHRDKVIVMLFDWLVRISGPESATKAFKKIYEQVKSRNPSKSEDLQIIAAAYFSFIHEYGDLVELIYDKNGKVSSFKYVYSLTVVPGFVEMLKKKPLNESSVYQALRVKSNHELLELALLSKNADLKKLTTQLVDEDKAYHRRGSQFVKQAPDWDLSFADSKNFDCPPAKVLMKEYVGEGNFQRLDASEIEIGKRLLVNAETLTAEYLAVANKIKSLSTVAHGVVQKEHEDLDRKLVGHVDDIFKAMGDLEKSANTLHRNQDVVNKRQLIESYENLQQTAEAGHRYSLSVSASAAEIKAKYQQIETYFEVPHQQDKARLKKNVDQSLIALAHEVSEAGTYLDSYKQDAERCRRELAIADVLLLLQSAIEDHLQFWHKQISFLGSRFKSNEIAVPRGIYEMHEFLKPENSRNYSAYQKLVSLKGIAYERKEASTGFFAKRNMNTTDKFYDIVNRLVLIEEFNPEQVSAQVIAVKAGLIGIGLRPDAPLEEPGLPAPVPRGLRK